MGNHVQHRCNDERCVVCESELGFCEVCRGGEATLPTECPGEPMSASVEDAVREGSLDFVNGRWVGLYDREIDIHGDA